MQNNIEICKFEPESLASTITDMWIKWDSAKTEWKKEKKELREYLFATDTRKTANKNLPWKNSTVTPKLTQIRDNLHANYLAALFPNENWFTWESSDKTANLTSKRRAIVEYMKQKLKASSFQLLVSQLVYDYIDYGNVIAGHTFVRETVIDSITGDVTPKYIGPKAFRVSPLDCVFNPLSESFEKTPFIRRVIKSVGDFLDDVETKPALQYDKGVAAKVMDMRSSYRENPEDMKSDGLIVDGFGSLEEYINSDMVELLEFYGDIYDRGSKSYKRQCIVTIIDRKWVLRNIPNPSWTGSKPFAHCGWRLRPDNLWAQGPLDQLMGMQYRIDHLENLKADVFDQIAYPLIKVTGNTVQEFEFQPGEVIFCGEDGDVVFMRPDSTALQADLQIRELMERMEELAGAPRQAMGIRTPGEKTKYEVQSLENSAGRIFQSKVSWFERNILEPLLNSMLEEARRNFGAMERIPSIDPEFGIESFIEVTKEDISSSGKIYPMGARHFAEQAKFLQELSTTLQTLGQIPSVQAHLSGKAIAKALEENLGWHNYKLVKENVAVFEQAETQRLLAQVQEDMQVEQSIPVDGEEQPLPPEEGFDGGEEF